MSANEAKAMVVAEETTLGEVLPGLTVKDLDASVQRIRHLATEWTRNGWHLGRAILEVHESKSYRLRTTRDASGKVISSYRTFGLWLAQETGISRTHADRMMKTASEFTEAQALEIGMTKLAALLPAPAELRPQLLEEAKAESVSEVKAKMRELGKAKRREPKELPSPPPPAAEPDERMRTVATKQKVTIKLVGKNGKPAKALVMLPWTGELENEHHTKQTFKIHQNRTGEIVLVIKTKEDRW